MGDRLEAVVPAPVRAQVQAAEAALREVVASGLPVPVRMAAAQCVVAVVSTMCGKLSEFASPGAENFLSAERYCGDASTVLAEDLRVHLIEKYGSAAPDCDLSEVREGTLVLRWRATDLDIADLAAWLAASAEKAEAALAGAARQTAASAHLRAAASAPAELAHQAWAWLGGDSGGWP